MSATRRHPMGKTSRIRNAERAPPEDMADATAREAGATLHNVGKDEEAWNRVVFVLGAPRSGTTWIAKILDSHPDVLYRHEPDIALRDYSFPTLCESAEIPAHRAAARAHLERLLAVRTLRATGSRPVFRKSWQGAGAHLARLGLLLLLQGMVRFPPARDLARRVAIPDFGDWRCHPELRVVLKSVSALGRAGLYTAAAPRARFVLILRHPCGQVDSMLRGKSLAKFEGTLRAGNALGLETARQHGLARDRFEALPPAEQFAWDWTLLNQLALEQMHAAPWLKILRYEDVCAAPLEMAEELLAFAGLSWNSQTERFLGDSTTYRGRDSYYQIYRTSHEAARRWRQRLSPEVQRAILAIALRTEAGRLYVDADD